jgi:hypothetical protein
MKPTKSLKVIRDIHRTDSRYWEPSLALACCGGEIISGRHLEFKSAARIWMTLTPRQKHWPQNRQSPAQFAMTESRRMRAIALCSRPCQDLALFAFFRIYTAPWRAASTPCSFRGDRNPSGPSRSVPHRQGNHIATSRYPQIPLATTRPSKLDTGREVPADIPTCMTPIEQARDESNCEEACGCVSKLPENRRYTRSHQNSGLQTEIRDKAAADRRASRPSRSRFR